MRLASGGSVCVCVCVCARALVCVCVNLEVGICYKSSGIAAYGARSRLIGYTAFAQNTQASTYSICGCPSLARAYWRGVCMRVRRRAAGGNGRAKSGANCASARSGAVEGPVPQHVFSGFIGAQSAARAGALTHRVVGGAGRQRVGRSSGGGALCCGHGHDLHNATCVCVFVCVCVEELYTHTHTLTRVRTHTDMSGGSPGSDNAGGRWDKVLGRCGLRR